MEPLHEETRIGVAYVEAVTALLRRMRSDHPTKGLFEPAEVQWWWRIPRPSDDLEQLFWFDLHGRPVAAAIVTDWGDRIALDPLLLPDAAPDRVAQVVERGLDHAAASGFGALEVEVDPADDVLRAVLDRHGFAVKGAGVVETWLAADARPPISPLDDGYRLSNRVATGERPHHLSGRSGPDVEARLHDASLYRPDLDLVVLDGADRVAAYGLFWYDPVTATGVVEPMRTEDEHQQHGLARHVLTTGIDLLAAAGAERIKICFEPDNPAARSLYLSVGFDPVRQTEVLARTLHGMVEPSEWTKIIEEDPQHSQRYIERFRKMEADGVDLGGEARLIDAMVARDAHVLDAGCGPGRVGAILFDRGHRVVGVDGDPALIDAAEQDHPGPTWIVGDLAELDLPAQGITEAFDVIVCAGNVMAFLAVSTRRLVLERMRAHLAADGRLVVGFGSAREYDFDDFFDDVAAAGLQIEVRLSTWDLRPFVDDSDFLVAVLSAV